MNKIVIPFGLTTEEEVDRSGGFTEMPWSEVIRALRSIGAIKQKDKISHLEASKTGLRLRHRPPQEEKRVQE